MVAAADRNCTKTVLEASALDEITDDLKELKVSDRWQDDQIAELRKEVETLTAEEKREKVGVLYPPHAMREPCLTMPSLNKVELQ